MEDHMERLSPRKARGRVRRARSVLVSSSLAGGRVLLVEVSKRAALRALTRARQSVSCQELWGSLILGE